MLSACCVSFVQYERMVIAHTYRNRISLEKKWKVLLFRIGTAIFSSHCFRFILVNCVLIVYSERCCVGVNEQARHFVCIRIVILKCMSIVDACHTVVLMQIKIIRVSILKNIQFFSGSKWRQQLNHHWAFENIQNYLLIEKTNKSNLTIMFSEFMIDYMYIEYTSNSRGRERESERDVVKKLLIIQNVKCYSDDCRGQTDPVLYFFELIRTAG